MGKIILFMGPSSSGKDAIIRRVLAENKFNLKSIILHTTRPMRYGEENGREYYFCQEQEMRKLEEENAIIEQRKYDTVYGPWYYFTAKSKINLEKNSYITSNTLEGLDQYLKHYRTDQIISILINTKDGVRLARALEREQQERNPKYQEMCRRFLADCKDFSSENIKKRNITAIIDNNSNIEETMKRVNKVLSLHL